MSDDKATTPDFLDIYDKYYGSLQPDGTRKGGLDNGLKAQLRRTAKPDDLRDTPALYRLFNQARPHDGWLRVVFLLPWCEDCKNARRESTPRFGRLLAEAGVSELRLFQVARSFSPLDVIQLQRLAKMLKYPHVDWKNFGWLLYRSDLDGAWSQKSKRQLIEDYFIGQPAPSNKKEATNEH
jgi:CRISPR system Cascade subunit CasB